MAKHTPGPWHMFNTDYGIGVSSKHSDIAHCRDNYSYPLDSRRKPEEDIANATAMAAVPAMIDALAMIMKHALQAQMEDSLSSAKGQANEIEALALGALKKAGVS